MISSAILIPMVLMCLGITLLYLTLSKKPKTKVETLEEREVRAAKAVEDGSVKALIAFCKKPTDRDTELKMYAEFELLFRRDIMRKYRTLDKSPTLREIDEYFQDV